MATALPPLTWQTSANNEPELSDSLPDSVVSCLQNARYLHLATCTANKPHVSLMNYTYLPTQPFAARHGTNDNISALPTGPFIIMTTNPSSRKTLNLLSNPSVSLLVHDWVSSRPPPPSNRRASPPPTSSGPSASSQSSSLATLLMGLNTTSLGSISATINGIASVLDRGSEEERWCREQHLRFNGYGDEEIEREAGQSSVFLPNGIPAADHSSISQLSGSPDVARSDGMSELRRAETRQEEDDVRVVVVRIVDGRIADHKGGVRDFALTSSVSQ